MNVRDLIIRNEGMRLKPYKDSVGKLTIGVGRNLDDVGISHDEAMAMLDVDVAGATKNAEEYPWFHGLDEVRKAAVVDMIFNLGPQRFSAFFNFRQAMSQRQWEWARSELVASNWHTQVGARARRTEQMILTGQWPTEV